MPELASNVLYYGDNLDILRRYLPDATEAYPPSPQARARDPVAAQGSRISTP